MEGPYWACARLEQHRETLGLASLERGGFQPYYPRLREHRRTATGRKIVVMPALFLGYAFIVIRSGQWYSARWSPGIINLIMDGLRPGRVPDQVIAELRNREINGCVELPKAPQFKAGDAVRITGGAFAGLFGLVAGMKSRERVELLLAALGRATVPVGDVELA
jgi:transcriptional antiterminator RfaH